MNKNRKELKRIINAGIKAILMGSSWDKEKIINKLVDQLAEKEKWEAVFQDSILDWDDQVLLNIINTYFIDLIYKYKLIGKVQIKARDGAIIIERIK